jgi:hypothetical protein
MLRDWKRESVKNDERQVFRVYRKPGGLLREMRRGNRRYISETRFT